MILEFSIAMNIVMLAMLIIWTKRIEILKQYRRDHMAKITELEEKIRGFELNESWSENEK